MRSPTRPQSTTAVIGGAPRDSAAYRSRGVRHYPSRRSSGNGNLRGLLAAIRAGGVTAVYIRIDAISHAESDAVRAACRRAGIVCRPLRGNAAPPTTYK